MENLLRFAATVAVEAGKEIMRVYQDKNLDFGIEEKSDKSPLTQADKAAHKSIVAQLRETGIPVLSEEGNLPPYEERQSWHRLWLVDPLDGTKEFISRNGEFTVNIALIEDGKPVLGVIYVPVECRLYLGIAGMGAWRVDDVKAKATGTARRLSAREQKPLEAQKLPLASQTARNNFVVVASRSHLNAETERYIKRLSLVNKDLQLISSGSSLKMCLVAEGTADVYPRFAPTMEWDTAAGDAIARAAGAEVFDAETGQPLTYNKPDMHNPWFIVSK